MSDIAKPRYTILIDADSAKLIEQVNEYINNGWRPQGGLVLMEGIPKDAKLDSLGEYWGPHCYYYAQAMFLKRIPARSYALHRNEKREGA